jgi:type II secretory pathway pseudopilin PulG
MAPAPRRAARDASGFTLIETLVAMVTGLVVVGAAYAILEVSLHQSSLLTDVTQATQLGRVTMTRMVDELHSACIAPKFAPVQAESTEKKLIFIDAYTEKAEIATAYKHEIVLEGETLTDKTYNSNGGSWPKFTFPGAPTSTLIFGQPITRVEPEKEKWTPLFQYYAYATKTSSGSSTPSSTLNETNISTTALTTKQAESVGAVRIVFNQAPTSNRTKTGRQVEMTSQNTLAFSAPSSESTIVQGPCE